MTPVVVLSSVAWAGVAGQSSVAPREAGGALSRRPRTRLALLVAG